MLGEISQLDASLGRANERLNLANIKLDARPGADQGEPPRARHREGEPDAQPADDRQAARHALHEGRELAARGDPRRAQPDRGAQPHRDRGQGLVARRAGDRGRCCTYKSAVKLHARQLKLQNAQVKHLVAQREAEKQTLQSQIGAAPAAAQLAQRADPADDRRRSRRASSGRRRPCAPPISRRSRGQSQTAQPPSTFGATRRHRKARPWCRRRRTAGAAGVALSYIGTPYVWAGSAPGGFDCSGLVMYAYSKMGVSLPHSSYAHVERRASRCRGTSSQAGRPRLLRRPRPRGHLHRQRPVRPRAAHRRRREGVEPRLRLVRLLRTSAPAASSSRRAAGRRRGSASANSGRPA